MMTITIDDILAARLRSVAAAQGKDPNQYAVAALRAIVEHDESEPVDWTGELTREDWAAIDEGIERGIEAAEAGRTKPAEAVFTRLYSHLPNASNSAS